MMDLMEQICGVSINEGCASSEVFYNHKLLYSIVYELEEIGYAFLLSKGAWLIEKDASQVFYVNARHTLVLDVLL